MTPTGEDAMHHEPRPTLLTSVHITTPRGRFRTTRALAAAMITPLLAAAGTAAAQCDPQVAAEIDDVVINNLGTGDYFGSAVAIDGETAVVGAPYDNRETGTPLADAGSILPFVRSGGSWMPQGTRIFASNASAAAYFGHDVDIDGNRIVACTLIGDVFVFTRTGTTWMETAHLTISPGGGPLGGLSVAIDGDTIVVGAPYDHIGATDASGAIYVFVYNGATWVQQAKLNPSDAAEFSFQYMGGCVAIDGDTAVAGSNVDAAYVFVRSGTSWSEQAMLTAPDADGNGLGAGFGRAAAIVGDRLLVGAPADTGGVSGGAVYFMTRDAGGAWSLEDKVLAYSAGEGCGSAVDLYGDAAVVGARQAAHSGVSSAGLAHILTGASGAWSIQTTLLEASDIDANDGFGAAVALSGDMAVVGAPGDNWTNLVGQTFNDTGAATFFEVRCDGACCLSGSCAVLSVGDCNALGGVFGGVNSGCAGAACEPAGAPCPADVAPPGGDGVVNVPDLLALLAAWGSCP
jgi:hypothetical protein